MKTGGGKTVSALYIAGVLGVSTLVIVPSNTLAAQWREEAIRHLGLPPESIGQIKSGAYPRNKPLVIAVVHNLFEPLLGDYGDQFGLVIADECHRMGAREFSKAAGRFASVYRIALTATPRRRDGCWPLVESFYGPVLVKAEDDDMETHCIQIDMDTELPERMDSAPLAVILKYLSRHKKRNADLAGNIIDLYRRGRRILVMSDRVEQLQCLQTLVRAAGIPGSETAFYTGFTWTNPEKRLGKVVIKEEQRKRIRDSRNLRIVFGTYAQMVEGVSIDWLDCGIDALPRADGAQMIGRIRRRLAGKPTPCWITPVDGRIALLKAFAMARLRTMAAEGVTIH
jgi:superfamily II DNA or RNA helicase